MMKTTIVASLALAACTDGAVSYSDAVGISMKARSSDVIGGEVIDEKSINTESGNPFGAFVADARSALHADPGSIEVERVELALVGGSVAELRDVFAGDVEVAFELNDTHATFVVASGTLDPGAVSQELPVTFSSEIVDSADYPSLLGGSFKVITHGGAAPGFDGAATADLRVTFEFAAFE